MRKSRYQKYNGYVYQKYLTKQEQEIWKKCKSDFFEFVKYLEIPLNAEGKYETPKLYEKQKRFIKLTNEEHFVIVFKSRQTGMSTISGLYQLWIQLFYPNSFVGILSRKGDEQTDFLTKKIKQPFSTLPPFLKDKVLSNNQRSMQFNNGSSIEQTTTTENSFRGRTITYLIVDEGQFIPHIDKQFQSIIGTMSKVIQLQTNKEKVNHPMGISIISTSNGIGNWFYNMWVQQINHENIYTPLKFHWSEIPEYDEKWYEMMKKTLNNDKRKIQQELDMKFLGSGDNFFDTDIISQIKPIDPIKKINIDTNYNEYMHKNEIWLWEEKINTSIPYVMGVDVQTKLGDDRSTIEIVNQKNKEQVQEYLGMSVTFKELQQIIVELNNLYHPIIQIERNNNGSQVIEYLLEMNESLNLYEENGKVGWVTSQQSRQDILNWYYKIIGENLNIVKSERLLHEMYTFEYNNRNKPEQSSGNHDDLIMQYQISQYVQKKYYQHINENFIQDNLDVVKQLFGKNTQNLLKI